MSWLLRLYPPAWQRRYRSELAAHLTDEPLRLRTAFDLIAGAVDAWLNPRSIPATPETGKVRSMITAARCTSVDISKQDALRSGAWMIGVTLALSSIGVALDRRLGDHVMIEALLNSAFFIALTVSSRYTFLRPYSRAARTVLIAALSVGWYAFFLTVSYVGEII